MNNTESLKCIYESENYIIRKSNKKFIISTFAEDHFYTEIAFKILDDGENIEVMFEN